MENIKKISDLIEKTPTLDIVFSMRLNLYVTAWGLNFQRDQLGKMLLAEKNEFSKKTILDQMKPLTKAIMVVDDLTQQLNAKCLEHGIDLAELYGDIDDIMNETENYIKRQGG